MDVQFWIWLAIIAISFIARALKKKPTDMADPEKPYKKEPLGPTSFEELLREIQETKAPKPKVVLAPAKELKKEIEYADYREVVRQEQATLENTNPSYVPSMRTNEVYDKAKADAFNRPSLEETMKLEDTVVRFDRLKGYAKTEQPTIPDFIAELNDPNRLKKAFILNEVLARKF